MVINNPKNTANNYYITSVLSSPPRRTRGNMATKKACWREVKNPDKTFFVLRREQQKAGKKLPGPSLVIVKQSFREPWTTLGIRKNFGIKSPKEAPPNERSEGQIPGDKSRAEIHEKIRTSNKSGEPRVCRREQKRQIARKRLRKIR